MGKVITIAIQKGGVGKTTITANLGAGLGLRGYRTLMIDTDPQASLSEYFGVDTDDDSLPILGDLLVARPIRRVQDVIIKTKFENLSLVPTNINLEEARFRMESDSTEGARYLEKVVNTMRNDFDVILIDANPSFSILFINSLVAADSVIVPVGLQKMALNSLKKIQQTISKVQEKIKPIQVLGIVGTLYDGRTKDSAGSLDALRQAVGENVFKTYIRRATAVGDCVWENKPIQYFDRSSIGFDDFEALTTEVIERAGLTKLDTVATN